MKKILCAAVGLVLAAPSFSQVVTNLERNVAYVLLKNDVWSMFNPPEGVIDAKDVVKAYEENALRADRQYKDGRRHIFVGEIQSIDSDDKGRPRVETKTKWNNIILPTFTFKPTDAVVDDLLKMKAGEMLVARCTCTGKKPFKIAFESCNTWNGVIADNWNNIQKDIDAINRAGVMKGKRAPFLIDAIVIANSMPEDMKQACEKSNKDCAAIFKKKGGFGIINTFLQEDHPKVKARMKELNL